MKMSEIRATFPRLYAAIEHMVDDNDCGNIVPDYDIPDEHLIQVAARAADFFGDKLISEVMSPEDVPESVRAEWDAHKCLKAYETMASAEANYIEYLVRLAGADGEMFSTLLDEIFDGAYSGAVEYPVPNW